MQDGRHIQGLETLHGHQHGGWDTLRHALFNFPTFDWGGANPLSPPPACCQGVLGAPTRELILNFLKGNLITVVTMTTGSDGCSSKWVTTPPPGNKAMSGHRGRWWGRRTYTSPSRGTRKRQFIYNTTTDTNSAGKRNKKKWILQTERFGASPESKNI